MIRKETVIKRSERLSAKRKKLLKAMANSADAKAPIIMRELSWRSMPRRMKEPSPPAPIRAAKVAVPIIITAAVRTPDIMMGMAKGIS